MVSTLHVSIAGWTCSLGLLLVLPSSRSVSKSTILLMLTGTSVGVIYWAGVSQAGVSQGDSCDLEGHLFAFRMEGM